MNREDLERLCSGRNLRDWIAGQVMGRLVIGSPYEWLQFGVLQAYRVMLKPVIWIAAVIVALLMMLGGCANGPLSNCDQVDIEHHRKGGKISGKATWEDCRPIQAPMALPAGL